MGARVIAIGTDVIHIPRLQRVYRRYGAKFTRRAFHPTERAEFLSRAEKCAERGAQFLASRWAAKEAVYKALSSTAGHLSEQINFPDIVVSGGGQSGTTVALHGSAKRIAHASGVNTILLSLSHETDYAVACVVATGEKP